MTLSLSFGGNPPGGPVILGDVVVAERIAAGARLRSDRDMRLSGVRRAPTLGLPADAVEEVGLFLDLVAARLASRTRLLVTFVNPASRGIALRSPHYAGQLMMFDAVLPDGSGMSTAIRLIHRVAAKRISFDSTSLAPPVMSLAQAGGHSVALVGGTPGRAETAAQRLRQVFPKLRIVGTLSGFEGLPQLTEKLLALDPDVVVCGMGAIAQETLLLTLAEAGWQGCGFTCGGYLDQLSTGFDYYPRWADRLNMRWAYRLGREPRRLWRRYAFTYPPFVGRLIFEIARHKWRRLQLMPRFLHRGARTRAGAPAASDPMASAGDND